MRSRPTKDGNCIIFLDFDGVLVNHRSWYVRHPTAKHAMADPPCVAALNAITDATAALIVVSSTWRIGTMVADLRGILVDWGVTGKVIDKTPRLVVKSGSIHVAQPRGAEIQRWLDDYPRDVDSFVILDDDADMGHLGEFLVKTEFEAGLTAADAERATEILAKRKFIRLDR